MYRVSPIFLGKRRRVIMNTKNTKIPTDKLCEQCAASSLCSMQLVVTPVPNARPAGMRVCSFVVVRDS